jgi:glutathionylspermidine synthase
VIADPPSTIASREDEGIASLLAEGIIDDPWLGGVPRVSCEPVVLERAQAASLAGAAVAVAMLLDEAVAAVAGSAQLQRRLGMDESLSAVAALAPGRWLALARADVFAVDGAAPQACELNCDTPTGLAECVALARIAARGRPELADPSAALRERWLAMVRSCLSEGTAQPVVGILHPTEMTEDLGHVRLLMRWLEEGGIEVVTGSPFNLHACPGGRVGIFDRACDVLIRHYKTDWWARRASPWLDEPAPSHAAPLERELELIRRAQDAGLLAVVNPWGAAIAQNKRLLALPWEMPELFAPRTLEDARRHLPETRFLESLPRERLIDEREQWVLKSDYGCEGEEVLLGEATGAALWAESLRLAASGRWIAQRAFAPRRDREGRIANHGIYLIGGRPSGIYTRRSVGPTGYDALSVPTLVRP